MSDSGVQANIRGYTKVAPSYDDIHPEIFNDREQRRVAEVVEFSVAAIGSDGRRALDYGCGSGNLTRHLLDAGLQVTSADVTPAFLALVADRFGVDTLELRDGDVGLVPDDTFDLIGMYSVLHHIPDYMGAIRALGAKLKPGGVLVIEHERNHHHWFPTPELSEFRKENHAATRKPAGAFWDPEHKRWQHLTRAALSPKRHIARWHRYRRTPLEGDLHVWPDDHIDWDLMLANLQSDGLELVRREDYLQFIEGYDAATWERWRDRCDDQTGAVLRKPALGA